LYKLLILSKFFFLEKINNSIIKYRRVACGIIARSAGLFENTKRLCTCSGATVWQERQEAKERFQ
jgi:copper chaperone for superoxide dismutase